MRDDWPDKYLGIEPLRAGTRLRNKVFFNPLHGTRFTYVTLLAAALEVMCVLAMILVSVLRDVVPGDLPWWCWSVVIGLAIVPMLDTAAAILLVRRHRRAQM